jgi:hypothetical protein
VADLADVRDLAGVPAFAGVRDLAAPGFARVRDLAAPGFAGVRDLADAPGFAGVRDLAGVPVLAGVRGFAGVRGRAGVRALDVSAGADIAPPVAWATQVLGLRLAVTAVTARQPPPEQLSRPGAAHAIRRG